MKKTVFLSCAAIAFAAATGAKAAVFDFSTPIGDLGSTHTYTSGLLSTTLTAFGTPTADLFGKADGGDENGVGMSNDSDHEIAFGKGFIQVDTLNLTSVQFAFGSTTEGETWSIFGSTTSGVLGVLLPGSPGTSDGSNTPVLAPFRYYDITSSSASGGANILVRSMTAVAATIGKTGSVPEPATWAIMLVGFGGVGAILRRRRGLWLLAA